NFVFTTSSDGTCVVYDPRANIVSMTWSVKNALSCSDISGFIVATGSDKDLNNISNPIIYNESHGDDVTFIKFHEENTNMVFSSDVDGLISCSDYKLGNEDESLQMVLNEGTSVSSFNFLGNSKEYLSCLTHTENLSVWDLNNVTRIKSYGDLRTPFLETPSKFNYALNSMTFDNHLYTFCGSQSGALYLYHIGLNEIKLYESFLNGHSDIVRTCEYNQQKDYFISGGEDGIISFWTKQLE
ncbi:WD40 repeat-like protein, partial [Rozella allomycis CSF55]